MPSHLASITVRYSVAASAATSSAKCAVDAGFTRTITRSGSSVDATSASRAACFASSATASSRSRITASARSAAFA